MYSYRESVIIVCGSHRAGDTEHTVETTSLYVFVINAPDPGTVMPFDLNVINSRCEINDENNVTMILLHGSEQYLTSRN